MLCVAELKTSIFFFVLFEMLNSVKANAMVPTGNSMYMYNVIVEAITQCSFHNN